MTDRTQRIIQAHKAGLTLLEIGVAEGVTGEWIRRLLKEQGLTGANSERRLSKTAAFQAKVVRHREERSQKLYRCDWSEFRRVTGADRFRCASPLVRAYMEHKKNANRASIAWEISLPEYAALVGPHLDEIGRGRMTLCRSDKRGPFSTANCSIRSQSENSTMTNGLGKGQPMAMEAIKAKRESRTDEIMKLLAAGVSRGDIAKRLGVSRSTVNSHIYRVQHAVGIAS